MDASLYRLVVTSGPTREWIDPVRFLSNPSSGHTGFFLARRGVELFREVVFISGPVAPPKRQVDGARNVPVETTEEMASAVQKNIGERTLLVMAAAPADFTPDKSADQKIKKGEKTELLLRLRPATDILMSIRDETHPDFYRVGFAAETNDLLENARRKLERKNLDFICANEVFQSQKGFGAGENALFLLDRRGKSHKLGPSSKEDLASTLLAHLTEAIP